MGSRTPDGAERTKMGSKALDRVESSQDHASTEYAVETLAASSATLRTSLRPVSSLRHCRPRQPRPKRAASLACTGRGLSLQEERKR